MNKGKRKLGNRILSVILTVLLVFSMVPTSLLSASAMSGDSSSATESETTEKSQQETENEKDDSTTKDETTQAPEESSESTTKDEQSKVTALTVVVKDSDGTPISGANVSVPALGDPKSTDSNGTVVFSDAAKTQYAVTVEKDGYVTWDDVVDNDGSAKEIVLTKEAEEPKTVMYSASVTVDGSVKNDEIESVKINGEEVSLDTNGEFTKELTAGKDYTVVVTPKNDKAYTTVTYNFTATTDTENGSFNLESRTYTVTINNESKGTYKYNQVVSFNVAKTGLDVSSATANSDNGTEVDFIRTGNDILFHVTGNISVTVSYQYTAEFKIGENGKVLCDGQNDTLTITKDEKETVSYTVTADPGYRISMLKVDDLPVSKAAGLSSFNSTVSKNSKIVVTFEQITYNVNISIANSTEKKGSASVTDQTANKSVSVEPKAGSADGSIAVNIANFDSEAGKHVLTLNTTVADEYTLEYSVEGSAYKKVSNNKVTLNIEKDTSVAFKVVPVEYTLTYVDPLRKEADKPWDTVKFSLDKGEVKLPENNAPGYTFLGWSKKVPNEQNIDSKDLLNKKALFTDLKGEKTVETLYAVYKINAADVIASSTLTYNGKDVETKYTVDSDTKEVTDGFKNAWFGNDVNFEVKTLKDIDYNVTIQDDGSEEKVDTQVSENKFTLEAIDGGKRIVNVSVGGSITHECTVGEEKASIVYYAEPSDFTVQMDSIAPKLTVKGGESSDSIAASDDESDVEAVEYAAISFDDNEYKNLFNSDNLAKSSPEYIVNLKNKLRGETWTKIETNEDGKCSYTPENIDSHYIVYRTRDKAGNDVYSSFDRTVPNVSKVNVKFKDASGDKDVNSGSVYANLNEDGSITFTVDITDKVLFYAGEDKDYRYDGCYLTLTEKGNEANKVTVEAAESESKFSPFKDKWQSTFVVREENVKDLLDKELKYTVTATDQAGNTTSKTGDGVIFVETEKPEIDVTFTAGENTFEKGKTVYHNGEVTANVTVGKFDFDPYYDGKSNASVTVKVDEKMVEPVNWTKEKDQWTASVVISDEGEHKLTVDATSQAGNSSNPFETETVIIDKTPAQITIDFNEKENIFPKDEMSYSKTPLTATLTVEDTYLYPIAENSNTAVTVKFDEKESEVTWTKTETKWTTTVELPTDEGKHTVAVGAADHSGNESSDSKSFSNDYTAPVVTGVSVNYVKGNGLLNLLTFGNFFNDEIKLTVTATDGSDIANSGVNSIVPLLDEDALFGEADSVTVDDNKTVTAVFTLDDKVLAKDWEKNLTIKATDNVGNESETAVSEVDSEDGIKADKFVYEKNSPTSTISYSKYGDNYIIKDENITINVTDVVKDETGKVDTGKLVSGLHDVTIKVSGIDADGAKAEKYIAQNEDFSKGDNAVESFDFTIKYNDLYDGKNEIAVTAKDNADNPYKETYTVYKDVDAPIVKYSLDGDNFFKDGDKHWLKDGQGITIGVADKAVENGTSGLKEASVYVNGTLVNTLDENDNLVVNYSELSEGKNTIKVTTKDNVENYIEYSFDVYKDVKAPEVKYNLDGDNFFKDGDKYWLKLNESFDISVADAVVEGDNDKLYTSGLQKASVVVEHADGSEKTYENTDGKFTVVYDDLEAGENKIKVTALDNVNNEVVEEFVVYKDIETPTFSSVKMAYKEGNRALNWLTFGIFFNDKIIVTVECSDAASGVAAVEMTCNSKTVLMTAKGDGSYESELPADDDLAADWKSEISFNATDNVGNKVEGVSAKDIDNYDNIKSDDLMYEKNSPTSTISYSKYGDNYIIKDENITINVTDVVKDETGKVDTSKLVSGLHDVTIKVSGIDADGVKAEKYIAQNDDLSAGESAVESKDYIIKYLDLYDGRNEIVVTANDNADNPYKETYTVYKDVDAPVISYEFDDNYYNESETKHWLKDGQSITVGVEDTIRENDKDMVYTAGLKAAEVYVNDVLVRAIDENKNLIVNYSELSEGKNTIKVTTKDNVENYIEYSFDVYKDVKAPEVKYNLDGDNFFKDGEKHWLMKDASFDIAVADAVVENDEEMLFTSGLQNANVVIEHADGTVETYENTKGDFTVLYKDLEAGENKIKVTAVDNVNNEVTEEFVVYKDISKPHIDSIAIDAPEEPESTLKKILNKLTFGIFFNAKVEVKLSCKDDEPASGIKQVQLLYNDENGKQVAITSTKGVEGVYTFTLPNAGKNAERWTAMLSADIIDNVGNYNNPVNIKDIQQGDLDDILSDRVLYEKDAPSISFDYEDYTKNGDNHSLYHDAKTNTYWMLKDKAITVDVDDNKADAEDKKIDDNFVSGLNNVTITITGEVDGKKESKTFKADDLSANKTVNKQYIVNYSDLYEGRNVITVKAEDNACNVSEAIENNKYEEKTSIVIWKDEKAPTVKGIKIYRIGEDESIMQDETGAKLAITRRSYGNFHNGAVKVDVSVLDEMFSSGIKSLTLSYVYTDENGQSGRIKGKMYVEEKTDAKPEQKPNTNANKNPNEKDEVLENADKSADVTSDRIFTITPPTVTDKNGNKTLIDSEGYLEIKVTDNTGHSYTFDNNAADSADEEGKNQWPLDKTGDDAKSNILTNYLMFEDNQVEFEAKLSDAEHTCENKHEEEAQHLWYKNTDIDFSVTVRDVYNKEKGQLNSGLRTVSIVLENSDGTHEIVKANLGTDSAPDYEETYEMNLKNCGAVEGKNTIVVTCTDNARNKSTYTETVYVDRTKPVVDYFSFKGVNGSKELSYDECKTVKKTDYGYFFSKDTEVTVHVSDKCPSSGIKKVYFVAIPAENAKPSTSIDTSKKLDTACCVTNKEGIYSTEATFKVKANFKGQIYAYVEDNNGYTSLDTTKKGYDQWVRPDGVIVETQALHNKMGEHIKIDILSTPKTYLNGSKNPLFDGNVKLRLSVDDYYSGIREVSYRVVAGHDTGKNFEEKVVVKNGTGSWSSKSDLNLTTFLSKEITVSNNSNDIKIYLSMVDNSGNVSTNENDPLVISIDKDAPEITVSYSPDDGGDDSEFTGYFKTDRTLTVKVKERNFRSDLIKIAATSNGGTYGISSSFGKGTEVVENGIQYFVYTMTHVFHNDADYTFAISGSDKAENKTDDNGVNYGSAAAKTVAKKFTIDQTLPEITVNISGQKGKGNYYKGDVTVEITVLEHNYTEGRYNAVFSARDTQSGNVVRVSLPSPSISGSGDVHHHTYVFTGEYIYKLESIKVVDMAGNEKDTYSGSYAGEDFVVDKTDPEIKFFTDSSESKDLDQIATKSKKFAPRVVITDTNLDAEDYTVKLTGNHNESELSGNAEYTYGTTKSADKRELKIIYDGFANKEEVDDIYTLTVSATDRAGCTTTRTVVFSVNRYGSTFMVSEKTKQILSKYYTNDPDDIDIVQINAAEISNQRVSLTKNGIVSDLKKDVDYTVSVKTPGIKSGSGKKITDSNWYECTYKIDKDNFDDEGIYSITVYSKDKANSVLTSATSKRTMYLFKDVVRTDKAVVVDEKDLEAPVNFQVDKTKPTATILDLDKSEYFMGTREFRVNATDEVLIDRIVLTVDEGTEYEYKETFNAEDIEQGVKYVLEERKTDYNIKVVAYDAAGNESGEITKTVLVTTNPFLWFMSNTKAQIVAGILVLILLVVLIIVLRRRKLRDAQ